MVAPGLVVDDQSVANAGIPARPVVLEAGSTGHAPRRRRPRPRTVVGTIAAALLAAGGVLSVWFAIGTTKPTDPPGPLWFSPPAPASTASSEAPAPSSDTGPPAAQPPATPR